MSNEFKQLGDTGPGIAAITWRGHVNSVADLPTDGNSIGDARIVVRDGAENLIYIWEEDTNQWMQVSMADEDAVTSVFTRQGAVTATTGDYTLGQIALPTRTVTVGPVNADYTTVQAALDANVVANLLVQVYPGHYINDTIHFTANQQSVKGMGISPSGVVFTQVTSNIIDYGAFTGCHIERIFASVTAATSAINTLQGSGSFIAYRCHLSLECTVSVVGTQPAVIGGTGDVTVRFGTLDYEHTGALAALAIKQVILLEGDASHRYDRVNLVSDTAGTALASTIVFGLMTANADLDKCSINLSDTGATVCAGLAYLSGTGIQEYTGNVLHVDSASGNAYAAYITGTSTIRSMFNHVHVTALANARSFLIGAGSKVIPQLDDIIAAEGYTNNGTLTFCSSLADGELDANQLGLVDGVTAPTAATGVAKIYVDTADGDLKVKFGDGHTVVIAADS